MSNKIKVGTSGKIFDRLNELVLLIAIILTVYPMIYILLSSISNGNELMKHSGILLMPQGKATLAAYKTVLGSKTIIGGFGMSFFMVTVGTTISIILTSCAAYFLSRKNVMLVTPIMMLIVITMFFKGGIVPEFLIYKQLGFVNSIWAPIIPFCVNTFNLIILRTAFYAIPPSLEESAKIDGAGHMTILFRVMLPLLKPTLAVLVLYYAVFYWNSWFWPSLLIRDKALYPLQVVLRDILILADSSLLEGGGINSDTDVAIGETVKYASIIVATLPILVVYPYLQKHFVKGVMVGAVKG
ncbi:carbohydrate ABC transporter permease [Clostridium grantii]|nr:carbohydrate ABC transporter permease [Clostridium grantii]